MRDKIAGALFGMALGDAMGMPAELWGRKRVKAFFGRIEGFLDGPAENDVAFNYKKGQFTDDTGQALVLLDSIASTDYEPDTRDIALRMLAWAEKENAFENNILGPTSKVALANFRDNIQDSRITDKALSNGSAMRIAPIGCLFRPEQKEEIARYVYQVSRATHTSDVTIAGAAMIAEAVSSAMVKDDFDEVMEDVFGIEELGYGMGCETFSPKLGERLKIGLDIAKAHRAYFAQDPNRSCLLCANMAGDTDTIGAMATAVCGAFTGLGQIKQQYIETLRQQNDADFDHYIQILEKGREKLA